MTVLMKSATGLIEVYDATPMEELTKPFPIVIMAERLSRKPRTRRDVAELLRWSTRHMTRTDRERMNWIAGVLDGTDSPSGARS